MTDPGPRQEARAVERRVKAATAGLRGRAYLEALVRELARATGCCMAYVARLDKDTRHEVLAMWHRLAFGEPITYDLEATPCEQVHLFGSFEQAIGAAASFPEDRWLHDEGIEGYVGVLLPDTGQGDGVLGLLHDEPLTSTDALKGLLERFAPLAVAALRESDEDASSQAPVSYRVLLVEANPSVRNLLERSLWAQGCRVVAVADADHARHCVQRERPEVLVLDAELPRDASAALAADVRASHPDSKLLAVASGEVRFDVDARLEKPFTPDEFARAIEALG